MRNGLEYCRLCYTQENLTLDHIIPRAFSGGNTINNITILCVDCNVSKGINYIDLPSLDNACAAGWMLKDKEEIRLGDLTMAGKVESIYSWVRSRSIRFVCVDAFWHEKPGCISINGQDKIWVFVGAEALVGSVTC